MSAVSQQIVNKFCLLLMFFGVRSQIVNFGVQLALFVFVLKWTYDKQIKTGPNLPLLAVTLI